MKLRTIAFILGTGLASQICASTIEFTYNSRGLETKVYGFEKRETYDVAVLISDPNLAGSKVCGFKVYLGTDGTDDVSGVSAWLTSKLAIDQGAIVKDIATSEVQIDPETGFMETVFPEPASIPSGGIYVGYSFTVDKLNDYTRYPVACIESEDNTDKGLFIHSSRSRMQWENTGKRIGLVSTMVITLEGDFGITSVDLSLDEEYNVAKGTPSYLPVILTNTGGQEVESISYRLETTGLDLTGQINLEPSMSPHFGAVCNVEIPLPAIDEVGSYPLSVALTAVNNLPCQAPDRTATLCVLPFLPVNRPLIEEYAGLKCGYCPKGFVNLELMKEKNPDDFVALSYHSESYERGGMVTLSDMDYPVSVPGFPYCTVNRNEGADPDFMEEDWHVARKDFSPASIEAFLEWSDPERRELTATITTRFAKDMTEADFAVGYAIAADNLHNAKWRQLNYFSGYGGEGYENDLWRIFTEGGKYVEGLVFNDIAVYCKDVKGIEGSLPENIMAGTNYTQSQVIMFDDMLNISGEQFINEDASLKCVAFIIDRTTGRIINSNVSYPAGIPSGIKTCVIGDPVWVSETWYTIDGKKVAEPTLGIYLRTVTMDDGTIRTDKIIR